MAAAATSVHADRLDVHDDLAFARRRIWEVLRLEHLRAAVSFEDDRRASSYLLRPYGPVFRATIL